MTDTARRHLTALVLATAALGAGAAVNDGLMHVSVGSTANGATVCP